MGSCQDSPDKFRIKQQLWFLSNNNNSRSTGIYLKPCTPTLVWVISLQWQQLWFLSTTTISSNSYLSETLFNQHWYWAVVAARKIEIMSLETNVTPGCILKYSDLISEWRGSHNWLVKEKKKGYHHLWQDPWFEPMVKGNKSGFPLRKYWACLKHCFRFCPCFYWGHDYCNFHNTLK